MPGDPRITDDDVRTRIEVLKADGFPPERTIQAAAEVGQYARGTVAEEAIRTIVPELPVDRLGALVNEHVRTSSAGSEDPCSDARAPLLANEMIRRGFRIAGNEPWKVIRPGGETLSGDDLCRLALLGVCVARECEREGQRGSVRPRRPPWTTFRRFRLETPGR